MKKFTLLALGLFLVAGMMVACGDTPGVDGGDDMGGDTPGAPDMVQMQIDGMKGQPCAMLVMALPPEPAVGMSWKYSTGMAYGIAAEEEGHFIVEMTMDAMEGVVQAFKVDPAVEEGANVVAAWIGKEGEAPEEWELGEMPEAGEAEGEAPEVEATTGEETIEIAGASFDATWSEVEGNKSWMVDGFMLKSEANGEVTMELTEYATEGYEPLLNWEGGEEEPAEEEPVEEEPAE